VKIKSIELYKKVSPHARRSSATMARGALINGNIDAYIDDIFTPRVGDTIEAEGNVVIIQAQPNDGDEFNLDQPLHWIG